MPGHERDAKKQQDEELRSGTEEAIEGRQPGGPSIHPCGGASLLDQLRRQVLRWRREFLDLTGDACRDAQGQLDPEKLKIWQKAHGLIPTGYIRSNTIEAARRVAREPPLSSSHRVSERRDERVEAASSEAPLTSTAVESGLPVVSVNQSDGQELSEKYPVKKVPLFLEKRLQPVAALPIAIDDWMKLVLTPHPDGPRIVGPYPIRVGAIVVRQARYLIWVEGGRIEGWMPVEALPQGGMRRGEWLLFSDGRELEALRDRPHDEETIRQKRPDLGEHEVERHRQAAEELDRDAEHFVAEGMPISQALKRTERVHKDVLGLLVQGAFQAFSIAAGTMSAEGAIQELGHATGRLVGQKTGAAPKPSRGSTSLRGS